VGGCWVGGVGVGFDVVCFGFFGFVGGWGLDLGVLFTLVGNLLSNKAVVFSSGEGPDVLVSFPYLKLDPTLSPSLLATHLHSLVTF